MFGHCCCLGKIVSLEQGRCVCVQFSVISLDRDEKTMQRLATCNSKDGPVIA